MSHLITSSSFVIELSNSELPPSMMSCFQEDGDWNDLSFLVSSCDDSVGVFTSVHVWLVFRTRIVATDSTRSLIFVPLCSKTSTIKSSVIPILGVLEPKSP